MYKYFVHLGTPMEVATKHQADPPGVAGSELVDWGSLSEEVMEQIFARMPVKEAVRASCVCKHWQSIVQSHSFLTYILQFRSLARGRPV